jgi:hypothetical protein
MKVPALLLINNLNHTKTMEQTDSPVGHHSGGIYNYFQGATIHNLVIKNRFNAPVGQVLEHVDKVEDPTESHE